MIDCADLTKTLKMLQYRIYDFDQGVLKKSIDWNLQLTQKFSYLEVALVHLVLKCIHSFAEKLPVESYETSLVLCHFSCTENCSYALLDALAERYSPKLIRLFIYLFFNKT